ncbi:uncharacterized protein LOC141700251, partial [Apium graveolens]|uniref:uncharacterized protein LOC141700251 n=1 Tax=Apium graveolens TaxID=4045 RepID=UPI003D7A5ED6
MWHSIPNSASSSDAIKGYNLILLDDNDSHIHAYIYPDHWKNHAHKIVEGGAYILSNFYTKQALGTLKPVSSRFIINFSHLTTVDPVDDDIMISNYKFEFVDLSDLFVVAQANGDAEFPEYATDVMGVVEGYENLSKIDTKFRERDILHFRISDGRNSSKVTVWGNLVVAMEAQYNEISKEEPIIMNFLCKVKVKNVEDSDGWWYLSCSKNDCFEEVTKLEGKYRCSKCSKNYPIVILAEDCTEAFNFVLFDRAAKRLVGKTSTKLIAEGYEIIGDPGTYLPQIIAFAGKEITLRIELNDDNILLNSTIFYAIDAFDSDSATPSMSATTVTNTETSNFGD